MTNAAYNPSRLAEHVDLTAANLSWANFELVYNGLSPFAAMQAAAYTDRDTGRHYARPTLSYGRDQGFEQHTEAHTDVTQWVSRHNEGWELPSGVTVRYGKRVETCEGSWTRYVVITRRNGLTFKDMDRIARAYGIDFDGDRSAYPGARYSNPGRRRRVTRTRVLYTQTGGWDI